MNTVEFGMWRPELNDVGMERMRTEKVDRIIMYSQQEWEYTAFIHFDFLVEYSHMYKIPFYVIVCTSKYVKPKHVSDIKHRNVIIQHWGTFFLSETLYHLNYTGDYLILNNEQYMYPFVSMNSKPHAHRCLMMDILAKYNLIERGAISWLEYSYPNEIIKENMLTSVSRGYPYEYWAPHIKKLTVTGKVTVNFF